MFGSGSSLADAEVVVVIMGTQDILQGKTGMSDEVLKKDVPGLKCHYPPEEVTPPL